MEIVAGPRYAPGLSVEEVSRQLGIHDAVKLASNESSLGASPRVAEALAAAARAFHTYPDSDAVALRDAIAERHGVHARAVVVGNGTTELIGHLARLTPANEAVVFAWPSFVWYRMSAAAAGRRAVPVPLEDGLGYDVDGLVRAAQENAGGTLFLSATNNPTGTALGVDALARVLVALPAQMLLVLDDAYAEYRIDSEAVSALCLRLRPRNTVVLRTFSKAFGLAALRIGYAVGEEQAVAALRARLDPFNTNAAAQIAARAALADLGHVRAVCAENLRERARVRTALAARGFAVAPSDGNFVYVPCANAADLFRRLLSRGVIVRTLEPYGVDALRITVGTARENDKLFAAIDDVRNDHA